MNHIGNIIILITLILILCIIFHSLIFIKDYKVTFSFTLKFIALLLTIFSDEISKLIFK